jgi:hypothetical protein
MTESTPPPPDPSDAVPPPAPADAVPPPPLPDAPPAYSAVPATTGAAGLATAPAGKIRNTGTCILLMIVTLGFYSWYWYFKTHDEMKRHTGTGLGGGIALVLAIFVGVVMPFLNSNEVGHLYERRGQKPPVTAVTGLWALLLGWFFFVGAIVWFVKTNGALNAYRRSLGAQ